MFGPFDVWEPSDVEAAEQEVRAAREAVHQAERGASRAAALRRYAAALAARDVALARAECLSVAHAGQRCGPHCIFPDQD